MSIQRKSSVDSIVAKGVLNYDPATFSDYEKDFFIEATADQVLKMIKPKEFSFFPGRKFITVDTETYSTGIPSNRMPKEVCRRWIKGSSNKDIPNDFPFCITICDGTHSFVVYSDLSTQFKEMRKLALLLEDPTIEKIAHNFDYDLHMCANAKVNIKGRTHDTKHLSKLTRANAFSHDLLAVTKEIDGGITEFQYMLDSYKAQFRVTDYRQFPRKLMTQYTCADGWNAMLAFEYLEKKILKMQEEYLSDTEMEEKRKKYTPSFLYDLEMDIVHIAYTMERTGILTNEPYKDTLIPELTAQCDTAEREIYDMAGTTFNINSGQQLEKVLIDLGYGNNIRYNRKTGNPMFDKDQMERLEDEGVPLVEKIQEYRKVSKLLGSFAIKLYDMADAEGYLHCNFNTIEAKTGRFSVTSPAMQCIPRRGDSRVRGAFIAPQGYKLYDYDFKSQEAIVLAHYSKAAYLLQMIAEGKDVHRATASIVFQKAIDEIEKAERDAAKSVGFAIVYGAGPGKVAKMTHTELAAAVKVMKDYLHNIPEVDNFIKGCNAVAKRRGYVNTTLNRQVYVDPGKEYACVNYVIQGSSADSTKLRMRDIYRFLMANGYKTRMVLQVHDSLLYIVADDDDQKIVNYLKWLQTERELFRVNVTADVATCYPTWRDKKDVEVEAIKPPEEQLEKMRNYNIWEEGLFVA